MAARNAKSHKKQSFDSRHCFFVLLRVFGGYLRFLMQVVAYSPVNGLRIKKPRRSLA
jgi:hypothetical protein